MDKFLEMQTFAAVVELQSFVKAADTLDISTAAVSRHVGNLESRLGVRLLHRTTRRLSLTEQGQLFYARCKELLSGIDDAENEMASIAVDGRGLLRVSAPLTFGVLHLAPLWGEFKSNHPQVTLDITLTDRTVDLVDEGYDLAIRIAEPTNSSLVSKQLTTTRVVLCASPDYLKAHGIPQHPSELEKHWVVGYSYQATKDEWQFEGPRGALSVNVNPCFRTNNGDTCRAAALTHQGIVRLPTFIVGADIAAGRLVELMPQFKSSPLAVNAVYPTRKFVPAKVRLLIEFLAQHFSQPGMQW